GHDTCGDRAAHPFGNLAALRSPFGQKWAHGFASPPHDGFALSRMRAVWFVWGFMASKGKGGQWRVAWDLSSVKLKTTFTRRGPKCVVTVCQAGVYLSHDLGSARGWYITQKKDLIKQVDFGNALRHRNCGRHKSALSRFTV